MNSTSNDLMKWAGNKFEYDKDTSYSESYSYNGEDGYINIRYDIEEGKVSSVSIWTYE